VPVASSTQASRSAERMSTVERFKVAQTAAAVD
jgi:hypothetical protein